MKLIIFDCDGTLVDSQHGIVEAMTRACCDVGLEPPPREHMLDGVGLSLPLAVQRLLPEVDEVTVARVVQGYRDNARMISREADYQAPLYDGILELIKRLGTSKDMLLGVATGKSLRGVDRMFDHYELHRYFVTKQTADTHPSKPHPSMIETAMREACVTAGDTVMIGDTTFDIEMAGNAGVGAIGVGWGYHETRDLTSAGAHSVVDDSAALTRAIDAVLGVEYRD